MSEATNSIPDSWEVVPLGEVAQPIRTRANPQDFFSTPFIGLEHVEAHTMQLLGTVPAISMQSSAIQFKPGDVLYGRLRPYLNKVYCPDFEGLCSAEFIVLATSDLVLSRYLQYFLNSAAFCSFATGLNTGDRPRVDFNQLANHPFPLPPASEQRRIVDELEKQLTRLTSGVQCLKHAQAGLKRYRAAVLKAACEGRLVPTEAELARAEGRAQPSRGLPAGWRWASLRDLGQLGRGKSKHRPRNDPRLFGGSYPFIQTGDVRNSGGRIFSYTSTYNELGLSQSQLWPAGTLCISIAANIAETGILGFPACFPDSVVGFVCADTSMVKYVEYYMRSIKDELQRSAPATAQKNINLNTLLSIRLPIPPTEELNRIIEEMERRISAVEALEATIVQNLGRTFSLRAALLRAAFEGRLVPQFFNDEPASVLLERIRRASPSASATRSHGRLIRGVGKQRTAHASTPPIA